MKVKTLLLYLFSFISVFSFGQRKSLKLDNEAFLMGTLSDYMGRIVSKDDENRIESFSFFEQSLVEKINLLFVDNYDDLSVNKKETNDLLYVNIKLYSKKLAEKINSNYTFKVSGWTKGKDTIFSGKLKQGIFKTELQKTSFIIGTYTRFGEKKNEKHCIRLYNSISKFAECEKILKELGCENIETEIIKNIPTNQLIYFIPSNQLKKYLKSFKYLRTQIVKDRDKMFKDLTSKYQK